MKIRINGETIDTENIFKIGKVEYFDENNSVYFYIYFFNKREILINSNPIEFFGKKEDFFKLSYEEKKINLFKLIDKVKNFRDEIEKVWAKNRNKIPEFNL